MLNQALDTAEARRLNKEARLRCGCHRRLASAFDVERKHPAECAHLSARNIMPRMRLQTRVMHPLYGWVLSEKHRYLQRIFRMGAHPPRQCANSAERQPAVKRRGHRATGRL